MSDTSTINSAAQLQQIHLRVFSKESAEKLAQLGKRALEAILKLIVRLSRIITAPLRVGSGLVAGNSVSPVNYGGPEGHSSNTFGAGEPFRRNQKNGRFPNPIVEEAAPHVTAKLHEMGFVNDDGASDALLFGAKQENEVSSLQSTIDGKSDIFLVLEGTPDDLKAVYQPILERISLVLDWMPSHLNVSELSDEAIFNIVEVAEDLERLQAALKLTEMQTLLISQNMAKSAASEYDSKKNDVLSYINQMQQKGAKQEDFLEGSVEGDLFRIVSLANRFKSAIAAREDFLKEILNQAKNSPELFSKLEKSIIDGRNRIREKTGVKPVSGEAAQVQVVDILPPVESEAMLEPAKSEVKPKVVGGMFSNSVADSSVQIDDADRDSESEYNLTDETEFVG